MAAEDKSDARAMHESSEKLFRIIRDDWTNPDVPPDVDADRFRAYVAITP